jgi:hypothetical protein
MLAAYAADPSLEVLRLHFAPTLREVLEVLISGLLARGGRGDPPAARAGASA